MMTRLFDLVVADGRLAVDRQQPIALAELLQAQGVFIASTTCDILPAQSFEGQKLNQSSEYGYLLNLLQRDQQSGSPRPDRILTRAAVAEFLGH